MPTGKHPRAEDEYAQTYRKWRRSVEQNRTQGRSRTRPDAYYEQTYREWREGVHEQGRRPRQSELDAYARLPLKMKLKQRYARRGWLVFADSFAALTAVSLLVTFGVRAGMLRNAGQVSRSMVEAYGPEQARELQRQDESDARELAQRKIDRLKDAPPGGSFNVEAAPPVPQPKLDQLEFSPATPAPGGK